MAKKLTLFSFMLAVSLIFSYVEALLPLDFIAPGIKLGLANCVVLLFVFFGNKKAAFLINICRVILACLLFGSITSLIYSLCGAVFSFIVMLIAQRTKFLSIVGISILGGVAHNIAQCVIARLLFATAGIFYYMPILILCGAVCGALTGLCVGAILKNKNIQNLFRA